MDDMKKLSEIQCAGGTGNFDGSIYIKSEKYNSLPEEIKNNISYDASNFLQKLREQISLEWVKCNEKDKRAEYVEELKKLFIDAGFTTIYVKVVDNQYSSSSYYYSSPWIEVTTQKGVILLGWRKRVINIDWSMSDIDIDGTKIFTNEKTTVGEKYIHAWGYKKAVEYLSKLNSKEQE